MHICYITAEYPIQGFAHGGVGTFTRLLGRNLVAQGIQVSVIRLAPVPKEYVLEEEGVTVYVQPEQTKLPLAFLWNSIVINKKIAAIHRVNPINIIETPELGLAFLKKRKGIQYVIRMHGGHHYFAIAENRPTEWKKVWQEKKSFAKADAIVAVSNYVGEKTKELLQLSNKKITVIYNPIDTSRFYKADLSKVVPNTILFAGSVIEKKGIRQLIQSLEFLVDEYPNIHLKIAGRDATIPGTNLPYRPVLEKEITSKIKNNITFLGAVPNFEMPALIEQAQICCFPSHMEAMPLAWLEVLAMGKIFIGSNTGPGPEAVVDGETGFLVNPHDPKAIANKIKYIFDNYLDLQNVGTNARNSIQEKFDITKIVLENIQYYKTIIHENNSRNTRD